jgi:hypothetical protein
MLLIQSVRREQGVPTGRACVTALRKDPRRRKIVRVWTSMKLVYRMLS